MSAIKEAHNSSKTKNGLGQKENRPWAVRLAQPRCIVNRTAGRARKHKNSANCHRFSGNRSPRKTRRKSADAPKQSARAKSSNRIRRGLDSAIINTNERSARITSRRKANSGKHRLSRYHRPCCSLHVFGLWMITSHHKTRSAAAGRVRQLQRCLNNFRPCFASALGLPNGSS